MLTSSILRFRTHVLVSLASIVVETLPNRLTRIRTNWPTMQRRRDFVDDTRKGIEWLLQVGKAKRSADFE